MDSNNVSESHGNEDSDGNDNENDGINSITNIKYGDIIELKNKIYEIIIINF